MNRGQVLDSLKESKTCPDYLYPRPHPQSFYITTAVPLVATMSIEPLAPMVS